MIKIVPIFIALISLLGGTWIFMDTRWAKSEDLVSVTARLDYKIKHDQVLGLRENIWALQAHYCKVGSFCQGEEMEHIPLPVQVQLQKMKDEQKRLEKELENKCKLSKELY